MNETHDINRAAAALPAHDPTTGEIRPAMSAKRAKFQELAVPRTKRVIKAIRILANMGGKARYNYEFAEADVTKIADTLAEEIERLRVQMIAPGRQLDIEFDL